MPKDITLYAYAKKHKLSVDTLKRWVDKGRIPVTRKTVTVERILINEDYKIKKV